MTEALAIMEKLTGEGPQIASNLEVMSIQEPVSEHEQFQQMDLEIGGKIYIDMSPKPRYTGVRYLRKHPEMKPILLKWFASPHNWTDHRIGNRVGAEPRTITQIRCLLEKDIEKQKAQTRQLLHCVETEFLEKALELAPDMKSAKDAMICAGISGDHWERLSGTPSLHIEINHHVDIDAKIAKLHEELNEKLATATVIESE